MKLLRLLLFPLSLLYGLGVIIRNLGYDLGLLKSTSFNIPVISIGNLAVGGSGKSPMTEYILKHLKANRNPAILSRGYGRKTTGFIKLDSNTTAAQGGDEPVQFKTKFPEVTVAVCENRVFGIEKLIEKHDLIILDDAFQHRSVKPGLSLLLFDFKSLNRQHLLLPSGDLREPWWGRKRADLLVVTKCNSFLSESDRQILLEKLDPYPHQEVFFSHLVYGNLIPLDLSARNPEKQLTLAAIQNFHIFLVTGIANPGPLIEELNKYSRFIRAHRYPDHHQFSTKNISKLVSDYQSVTDPNKIIITTEKDAQRLNNPPISKLLKGLPVYYLPVEMKINEPDDLRFLEILENYATEPAVNH